jgi:uncharacterized membrane protein
MSRLLQAVAVTMSGLLAGNELGTLIGAHPAFRTLSPRAEIEAEQALTRRLGRVMPLYMTGALATAAAAAYDRRGRRRFHRTAAGAGASATMLAITLVGNVPLNKRTLEYPADGDRDGWDQIRRRWERLHTARVMLDLAAFACLTSALAER